MSGERERARYIARGLIQNLLAVCALHFAFVGVLLYALYAPEPKLLGLGLYGVVVSAPAGVLLAFIGAQDEWAGNLSGVGLVVVLATLAGAAWIVWSLV